MVANTRVKDSDIPPVPQGMDLWTVYNALTAHITRPSRAVSERTRVDYQHMLHAALLPELVEIEE